MKKEIISRDKILREALSLLDEPFENWRTYNSRINTRVFWRNEKPKMEVKLGESEHPFLECELEDSGVLITTSKIYSQAQNIIESLPIEEISRFGNEFEAFNNTIVEGKFPRTNLVSLYSFNGKNLVFEIDSLYPAYFAKVLISKLVANANHQAPPGKSAP